ncbi:MAG: TfoX/Sxy family protein [Alphaproteobacteria bacterium]
MAYDEGLAQVFQYDMSDNADITTRKMFGGLCFMHRGHMLCGVHKAKDKVTNMAMFRVGLEQYAEALALTDIEQLSFTGRPMKGFVETGEGIFENDEIRGKLIAMALSFTGSLPAK